MIKKPPHWKLIEGRVDPTAEHFEIRLEEGGAPVARVGRGAEGEFVFEYTRLKGNPEEVAPADAVRAKIKGDLRFHLIEKGALNPWSSARDRLHSPDDSEILWGWVPGARPY